MVCKEDVVTWFKELTSHKRIDVMCTLLNMCLPFELRFLGTCLEDLGKRDFHDLRDVENRANNVSELSDLQCISEKRTQRKLSLYLALLHSCNHACSNGLFKILADLDFGEISNLTNNTSEENPLDELLLLYTLALNHPAFTYEQRAEFGNILVKLQEEENKLFAARHSLGIGLVYVKNPLQACIPCPASEDQGQLGPCTGMSLPPSHPGDPKARSLPPGLLPPGLSLPPEQLPASYVHVASYVPSGAPGPVPWGCAAGPIVMGLCPLPDAPDAFPTSPLVSRQSSPTASGSPSRAGSPAAERPGGGGGGGGGAFKGGPRRAAAPARPLGQQRKGSRADADSLRDALGKEMPAFVHSLQHLSMDELRRMGDDELRDLGLPPGAVSQLRAIVGKLQGTNGLCLRESSGARGRAGLNAGGPTREQGPRQEGGDRRRLRCPDAVSPLPPPLPMLAPGPCLACLPPAPPPPAAAFYCATHGLRALRLHDGGAANSSSGGGSDSSAGPSPPDTPSMASQQQQQPPPPPLTTTAAATVATTTTTTTVHHQAHHPQQPVATAAPSAAQERWSPAAAPKDEDNKEEALCSTAVTCSSNGNSHSSSSSSSSSCSSSSGGGSSSSGGLGVQGATGLTAPGRPRPPGLARGKSNPPGLQTVARGRGPGGCGAAPAERPGARRDAQLLPPAAPSLNGPAPPRIPPPQTTSSASAATQDAKMFFESFAAFSSAPPQQQPPPPPQPSNAAASQAPAPATYSPAFLPAHFAPLRAGSLFPSFAAPAGYMRPFPFSAPNGELVYGFHPAPGPQTPPPPPPTAATAAAYVPTPMMAAFAPAVPPPKLSCYNCGSHAHHASDCKDPTMEDMTKPGQYRLDFSPYAKGQPECTPSEK